MRNSWKEDIKKELDAFKKLEMVSAVKVCGCGCVLTGGGIQYMCSLDRLPYDRGPQTLCGHYMLILWLCVQSYIWIT